MAAVARGATRIMLVVPRSPGMVRFEKAAPSLAFDGHTATPLDPRFGFGRVSDTFPRFCGDVRVGLISQVAGRPRIPLVECRRADKEHTRSHA